MKKCLLRKAFDLLRNSNLNVPMYAYRFELLVCGLLCPLQSVKKLVFIKVMVLFHIPPS